MTGFKTILARAEERKGGAEALARLLQPRPNPDAVATLGDDRILAEMTKRVFSAGFAWSVIEAKWPGFEQAFLGFAPARLAFEPDDFWDALTKDARIVRNGAKIMSVRANTRFVRETAAEHGSFGEMLARWPSSDEVGLLAVEEERVFVPTRAFRLISPTPTFALTVGILGMDDWWRKGDRYDKILKAGHGSSYVRHRKANVQPTR